MPGPGAMCTDRGRGDSSTQSSTAGDAWGSSGAERSTATGQSANTDAGGTWSCDIGGPNCSWGDIATAAGASMVCGGTLATFETGVGAVMAAGACIGAAGSIETAVQDCVHCERVDNVGAGDNQVDSSNSDKADSTNQPSPADQFSQGNGTGDTCDPSNQSCPSDQPNQIDGGMCEPSSQPAQGDNSSCDPSNQSCPPDQFSQSDWGAGGYCDPTNQSCLPDQSGQGGHAGDSAKEGSQPTDQGTPNSDSNNGGIHDGPGTGGDSDCYTTEGPGHVTECGPSSVESSAPSGAESTSSDMSSGGVSSSDFSSASDASASSSMSSDNAASSSSFSDSSASSSTGSDSTSSSSSSDASV